MMMSAIRFQNFSFNSVDGVAGAVPETATWAIMLIGFGAIGISARRGRRRPGAVAAST